MKNIALLLFITLSSFFQQPFELPGAVNLSLISFTAADVKEINFDKKFVYIWDRSLTTTPDNLCSKEGASVLISVVTDNEDAGLIYHYQVTGGTIIGDGSSVKWNLIDTRPANYSVTVEIENSDGIRGKSLTKNIDLFNCPVCNYRPIPCDCPQITIESSSDKIRKNHSVSFEVKLTGGSQNEVEYHWTVAGGKIISGLKTSKISVKATDKANTQLTAKVEIYGLCYICLTDLSKQVLITR